MLHKNRDVFECKPVKPAANLPVVINYKQTTADCFSKGKQVDETGLVRIIQMNCSCLHREKGILERWAAEDGTGNSFCSQHIYEHRVNSFIHRDMSQLRMCFSSSSSCLQASRYD